MKRMEEETLRAKYAATGAARSQTQALSCFSDAVFRNCVLHS